MLCTHTLGFYLRRPATCGKCLRRLEEIVGFLLVLAWLCALADADADADVDVDVDAIVLGNTIPRSRRDETCVGRYKLDSVVRSTSIPSSLHPECPGFTAVRNVTITQSHTWIRASWRANYTSVPNGDITFLISFQPHNHNRNPVRNTDGRTARNSTGTTTVAVDQKKKKGSHARTNFSLQTLSRQRQKTMAREPTHSTHLKYLQQALNLARLSPPQPTNFRVGCVIVSFPLSSSSGREDTEASHSEGEQGTPLSTGYTLELPGNTHAEQCALAKLAAQHHIAEDQLGGGGGCSSSSSSVLTPEVNAVLYTTLEPCGKRLSGNLPCVERIIATRLGGGGDGSGGVRKVVFGAREPGTFVSDSTSLQRLDQAGVAWEFVQGLDDEILQVAMEGHVKTGGGQAGKVSSEEGSLGHSATGAGKSQQQHQHQGTNVDDISPEERKRQEALPRNPKKRMMEVDVPP